MNRSFLMLLIAAVLLGAALGGAFVGGAVYGRSQAATAAMPPGMEGGFAGGGQFVGVPEGAAPGPGGVGFVAPPGADGGFPGGAGGNGSGGRGGGLAGTVAAVDGNRLSLTTPQGNILATLTDDTAVSRLAPAGQEDLTAGDPVQLFGRPNAAGGIFQARAIVIIPEGTANPFAGGGSGGRRGGNGERGP